MRFINSLYNELIEPPETIVKSLYDSVTIRHGRGLVLNFRNLERYGGYFACRQKKNGYFPKPCVVLCVANMEKVLTGITEKNPRAHFPPTL
jgi:hypothetical protein